MRLYCGAPILNPTQTGGGDTPKSKTAPIQSQPSRVHKGCSGRTALASSTVVRRLDLPAAACTRS